MTVWLVMKSEALKHRPFPVLQGCTVIGREPHSDVRIAIPGVGPRHAEITYDRDGLRITDLGFGGGTLRNGESVREARLSHADEVTIGPVTFEVHVGAPGTPARPPARRDASILETKPAGFPVRPDVVTPRAPNGAARRARDGHGRPAR